VAELLTPPRRGTGINCGYTCPVPVVVPAATHCLHD